MTPTRLAVLWTVAVLAACSIPGSQIEPLQFTPFALDKWAHAVLFFGFGVLWTRAQPDKVWGILLAGVAFGIAIEIWQGLLPIGRSPDPLDALADAVGLVAGVGLARALARRT